MGLGSVSSDQILPVLSPDINVLTFHPHYHSFSTFLLVKAEQIFGWLIHFHRLNRDYEVLSAIVDFSLSED